VGGSVPECGPWLLLELSSRALLVTSKHPVFLRMQVEWKAKSEFAVCT
jgi:hypothetical protein